MWLEQLSELTGLGDRARPPVGDICLHGQDTVGHEINLVGHQPSLKKHNKNQCVAYSEGKYKKKKHLRFLCVYVCTCCMPVCVYVCWLQ